jgi:uncharacterized delta-60 repeat protein
MEWVVDMNNCLMLKGVPAAHWHVCVRWFLGAFLVLTSMEFQQVSGAPKPGSVDLSFDARLGPGSSVSSLVLLPDGRMLITGLFTNIGGFSGPHVVRLLSDGSRDASFNDGAGPEGVPFGSSVSVSSTVVQPDGKVMVGGHFERFNGVSRRCITRLNADGSLDPSFDPGLGAIIKTSYSLDPDSGAIVKTYYAGNVGAISLQADGKIWVGGFFAEFNGTNCDGCARLNPDGSIDPTFTFHQYLVEHPIEESSICSPIVSLGDGGTLVSLSWFANGVFCSLIRVDDNQRWGVGLNGGCGRVSALLVQLNGKILVGCQGDNAGQHPGDLQPNRILRLNSDGTLDREFSPGTGTNGSVNAVALQADGKILIGGDFRNADSPQSGRIARLNADGTVDASFDIGLGADGPVNALAIQPDGSILVAGSFTNINGVARMAIARLVGDPPPLRLSAHGENSGLQLEFIGETNRNYAISVSTNCADWLLWTNVVGSGSTTRLMDPFSTGVSSRFYRASSTP